MSLEVPEKDWYRAPEGAEKLWIGLALIWCLVLSLMMPFWHFKGKQNSRGETYAVTAQAFLERTDQFIADNKVGEIDGVPVVEPAPGTDVYLVSQMWSWYPILKLRKGESYRIHMSSIDLNHGFSLQPLNINFQVLPGYDHVITMTPTTTGEFAIVCNEFCGIGHDRMIGKIIVE
jgi:cytochrome c oxidase subunit 2